MSRLYRAVRGNADEVLEAVDVNRVVREAVQAARPKWKDEAEARSIDIEVVTELEHISAICGTRSELHDILLNLLFNAVDAMPKGGRITIRAKMLVSCVCLEVEDTGEGMNEDTQRRVFEPFFTTKQEDGTGLGLYTVYGTVMRWGGLVDVQSTPRVGTKFILELPLWNGDEDKVVASGEAVQTRSGKVLVVDDDETVRHFLSRFLSREHKVEIAGDGEEALARFSPGSYDVAVIDLGMPGMRGDEVAKKMKQLDASVVTVLISGWETNALDGELSVFDFRLQKPVDDLAKIKNVMSQAIELADQRAGGSK